MDAQRIVQYFFLIFIPIYFFLFAVLPAIMNAARIKPGAKRSVRLSVDLNTFIRRFDEKAIGQKDGFLSPYYAYGWKTVGKSFYICHMIRKHYPVVTLHAAIEQDAIVYTLTSAGPRVAYSEREEVRKLEVLLASLAGDEP